MDRTILKRVRVLEETRARAEPQRTLYEQFVSGKCNQDNSETLKDILCQLAGKDRTI